MDHRILVLSISHFYNVTKNSYEFKDMMDGQLHAFSCDAIGQMEVIPQFIEACKNTSITKMILMETDLVKQPLEEETLKQLDKIGMAPKDKHGNVIKTTTSVDFFRYRMGMLLKSTPAYEEIDVDERNPEKGFEELLTAIKKEYRDCTAERGDWKLWLDIHGAFREISMTMLSLMQMLTASLPEDLPEADLDDVLRAIPIDGVYSTLFRQNRNAANPIVDRTSFYRIFTESPLVQYMNYGQHLLEALEPEKKPPFVFISYKRGVEDKKRFAFLGKLKKAGIPYWYDQGIEFGAEWAKVLVDRNEQCGAMIVLACQQYFAEASYQCGKELQKALDDKKPVIFVSLDGTMPENRDYVWKDPQTGDTAKVTKAQIERIKELNNVILTENNGSINENYTIDDSVTNKLSSWLSNVDFPF